MVRVLVDEDGRARETRVVRSSGHARLDEVARTAVMRALFRPYVENGVVRPSIVTVPIEFALRGQGSALAQR